MCEREKKETEVGRRPGSSPRAVQGGSGSSLAAPSIVAYSLPVGFCSVCVSLFVQMDF